MRIELAASVVGVAFIVFGLSGPGGHSETSRTQPAPLPPAQTRLSADAVSQAHPAAAVGSPSGAGTAVDSAPTSAAAGQTAPQAASSANGKTAPTTTEASTAAPQALAAPSASTEALPDEESEKFFVTASALNVRAQPPDGPVVDQLPQGQSVTVYRVRDGWARISKPEAQPRWVSTQYLSATPPGANTDTKASP